MTPETTDPHPRRMRGLQLIPHLVAALLVGAVLLALAVGGPDAGAAIGSALPSGDHARLFKAGVVLAILFGLAAWGRRGRAR